VKAHLLVQAWLLLSSSAYDPGPAQNNPARVIIYRNREFFGGGYDIKINDKSQGLLPPNRYLQVDLPPGRVKIESGGTYFTDKRPLWLETQPGRTYYIKAVEEVDFLTNILLMAPMPDEQAQRELRGVKPVAPPRAK
jgi:hypothetical protein